MNPAASATPRNRVPAMLMGSGFNTVSPICTSTSAHRRSSASARSVSAATSGTESAAGSIGASSLMTRTNVSSCAWLAAPLRSASSRQAASSTNSPGVADWSSVHGDPGALRPNQRSRFPIRACNPAASAPAGSGLAGCRTTMHSMSRSGCGFAESACSAARGEVVAAGSGTVSRWSESCSTISTGGDHDESSSGSDARRGASPASMPASVPTKLAASSASPTSCAARSVGSTRFPGDAAGCESSDGRKAALMRRRMRRSCQAL